MPGSNRIKDFLDISLCLFQKQTFPLQRSHSVHVGSPASSFSQLPVLVLATGFLDFCPFQLRVYLTRANWLSLEFFEVLLIALVS